MASARRVRSGLLEALTKLAAVALITGDVERAETVLREALGISLRLHDTRGVAVAFAGFAHVSAVRGDGLRAAELLGAAENLSRRAGSHLRPRDRAAHAAAAAAVHGALPHDRRLAAAQQRGRGLTLAEAVGLIRSGPREDDLIPLLTPRELEVSQLVAQGLTNGQIAKALTISRHTAERHVENILSKLGLTSRVQVATWITKVGACA